MTEQVPHSRSCRIDKSGRRFGFANPNRACWGCCLVTITEFSGIRRLLAGLLAPKHYPFRNVCRKKAPPAQADGAFFVSDPIRSRFHFRHLLKSLQFRLSAVSHRLKANFWSWFLKKLQQPLYLPMDPVQHIRREQIRFLLPDPMGQTADGVERAHDQKSWGVDGGFVA